MGDALVDSCMHALRTLGFLEVHVALDTINHSKKSDLMPAIRAAKIIRSAQVLRLTHSGIGRLVPIIGA